MSEIARDVFEKHEIRKTRRQKTAFIEYVSATAAAEGYECRVEKGYFGARNIVVGNPDTARVVYTAHYDTCAKLPFPNLITPKSIGLYLLYQLILYVVLSVIPTVLFIGSELILAFASVPAEIAVPVVWGIVLLAVSVEVFLIIAGPANKHTANDNTSGVITLLEIMTALPAELRSEVALVFFDLEEMGLWGSAGFAAKHTALRKSTLLLNFDCVSDGAHFLFVTVKGSKAFEASLRDAFPCTEKYTAEVESKGVIYPSDQANFLCGVGVAALKKTKRGILYMDRIHTSKDTVFDGGNIVYLTEGAVRLTQSLAESNR